ncbi:Utp14 protein-domain-containing protein [Apiospora saccharicola]|uniref:Utp14 protein-domain-containing protein n=1 Tax=Apiospora saccharicola TaxID=335842 RepID=A0ABR1U771_9PEZI
MGGREAHGRPLMAASAKGAGNKRTRSKARAKTTAMNAFAIASDHHAEKTKRTPRNRGLDVDFGPGKVLENGDDEEDDDDDDEDERPRKVRRATRDDNGQAIEYGSDSDGNEWRVGVTGNEDDDSEIESDEAFGESDEERFDGYAFGGSKKKAGKKQDEEEEDSDDESLGSDAIDLAAALDMSMSDDDGPEGEVADDDSDDESGSDESDPSQDSSEDEDDSDFDGAGVKDFVSKFGGAAQDDEDEEPVASQTKSKIDLKDLGLIGIKDPQLKQAVKLMNKEKRSSKPQKLDVPLARRAQGRLDREVAYAQTNKTLDRWTETVKHNRRADHLTFPLAQNETGLAKLDNTAIQPINQKAATNELEHTILSIMEQSGLGPSAEKGQGRMDEDEEQQALSRQTLIERRKERELKSREDKRAKRLKKIKSKTFHRIHRKQREKEDMKEHEVRVAAGEVDSEEEREAMERQRATERMGARHRESKWAKMANKNGRAAWDEDVRTGIADMARRNEELRRRVDGRPEKGSDDDDDSDYSADSEEGDNRKRIMRELEATENANDGPNSKLLNLSFMKKSEAAKKKANDELTKQILKQLRAEDGSDHESDASEVEGVVGRKTFGGPVTDADGNNALAMKKRKEKKPRQEEVAEALGKILSEKNDAAAHVATSADREHIIKPTQGAWSAAPVEKMSKKDKKMRANANTDVLDLDSSAVVRAPQPDTKAQPKPTKTKQRNTMAGDDDASDDGENHMPIRFTEQELLDKAFGGLDVVADFDAEKHELQEEQDEKTIDKTMPGWGSWVGEGVSKREQKRHQGRFLEKQAGVKKTDRKDNKLKNVIISEKRMKKNDKYLASHLPHTYENQTQYERSLRLPLGPDWVTKQTFQAATKPRVMLKQGVIAPMSRPEH